MFEDNLLTKTARRLGNLNDIKNVFNVRKNNLIGFTMLILSSIQLFLLTHSLIFLIVHVLIFMITFYLFVEFKNHELIVYKITLVFLSIIFTYFVFLFSPHQPLLYYLTLIVPMLFIYTRDNKVFYSAIGINLITQIILFTFSYGNSHFGLKQLSFIGDYFFLHITTSVITHVVAIIWFWKTRDYEKNKIITEDMLTTANAQLFTKLHNLYYSKEKTSDITYHFQQFINNLDHSKKYLTDFLEEISTKTAINQDHAENVLYSLQHTLENVKTISGILEEEQNKTLLYQKESNHVVNSSMDEIKRLENILYLNQHNEENLNEMADSVSTVHSLVELIRGISNQINLLSLNAAIESSKTGEAGKGFSVIAKEIKHLQIDVLGTLTDVSTELSSIQRCYNNMKDNIRKIEKKSEDILTEKNMRRDLNETVNVFIKEFLMMNEYNLQKLNETSGEIESALKRNNSSLETTTEVQHILEDTHIHFNKGRQITNELKNILEELQRELIKTSPSIKHKKD